MLLEMLPNQKCVPMDMNWNYQVQAVGHTLQRANHGALFLYDRQWRYSGVHDFSCPFLERRPINPSILNVFSNFGDQIRSIFMQDVVQTQHVLPKLIEKCPNLKQITLIKCCWQGKLEISSKSLTYVYFDILDSVSEVEIDCENLLFLRGILDMQRPIKLPTLEISIKSNHLQTVQLLHVLRDSFTLHLHNSQVTNLDITNSFCGKFHLHSTALRKTHFSKNQFKEIFLNCDQIQHLDFSIFNKCKKLMLNVGMDIALFDVKKLCKNVKSANIMFRL